MLATHPMPGRPSRRVADAVMRSFDYACTMRDFRTASLLLEVLEDIHRRGVARFGGERRKDDGGLGEAAARLRRARLEAVV